MRSYSDAQSGFMMMRADDSLGVLKSLQDLDHKYARTLRERATLPGAEQRRTLASALSDTVGEERRCRERLAQTRNRFKQTEMDLRTAEDHLRQDERRLYSGEVTNPKELSQIEARASEERGCRAALEETYLRNLEEIEQNEHRLESVTKGVEETSLALARFDEEFEKRRYKEADQDRVYMEARAALLDLLPDQYRATYERVQKSHPANALVRIERGSCGGCHNSLAQAEIERATRIPGLSTCENCGRLLIPESWSHGRG